MSHNNRNQANRCVMCNSVREFGGREALQIGREPHLVAHQARSIRRRLTYGLLCRQHRTKSRMTGLASAAGGQATPTWLGLTPVTGR